MAVAAKEHNTAMGAAFATAGLLSSEDRLMQAAIAAWGKFPGIGPDIARREYLNDKLRGEMTFSLILQYDKAILGTAIAWILTNAERAIIAQRPSSNPVTQMTDHAAKRGSVPAVVNATPKTDSSAASKLTAMADKQAARAAASAATAIRLTRLDTFIINGQKIGDLTATEANAWAGSRERDARFVRLLTANLPPDRPIREFRSGDDADELYLRAETVDAA